MDRFVLILLLLGCCAAVVHPSAKHKMKMIIDTDGGVDDAEALLVAACDENVDLLAVTVTSGITDRRIAARNIGDILSAINRTDIPVFVGSSSLLGLELLGHPYGRDGFADVTKNLVADPIIRIGMDEHASIALTRLVRNFPGEIRLVSTGPLTNIALAVKLDDTFLENLDSLYVTGGNRKPGRPTTSDEEESYRELNFVSDPESVYIILDSLRNADKLVLIPYDTCFSYADKISKLRQKWFEKGKGAATRLIREAMQRMGEQMVPPPCASLTVVSADPSSKVIRAEGIGSLRIELFGAVTRGLLVSRHPSLPNNVRLVFELDFERVVEKMQNCYRRF